MKAAAPFALIIDDEQGVCRTIAVVLDTLGVESASYQTASSAIEALDQRRPDIIFVDMSLEQSDALDVMKGLSEKRYTGIVQLMSGGRLPMLEAVQRIGAHNGLVLRPPLQKPFRADAIRAVIAGAGLARCAAPPQQAPPCAINGRASD
jgi:two-component system nitrogen regulation response regulator NtrX